jgi:hypothetical protein
LVAWQIRVSSDGGTNPRKQAIVYSQNIMEEAFKTTNVIQNESIKTNVVETTCEHAQSTSEMSQTQKLVSLFEKLQQQLPLNRVALQNLFFEDAKIMGLGPSTMLASFFDFLDVLLKCGGRFTVVNSAENANPNSNIAYGTLNFTGKLAQPLWGCDEIGKLMSFTVLVEVHTKLKLNDPRISCMCFAYDLTSIRTCFGPAFDLNKLLLWQPDTSSGVDVKNIGSHGVVAGIERSVENIFGKAKSLLTSKN